MGASPGGGEGFRLVFVCTGNTCRSPMAEVIARRRASEMGWRNVEIASAGVGAFPGSPASGGALRTAAAHGLDLSRHASTLLTFDAVEAADLLLTMSGTHLLRVAELGAGDRAALLSAYAAGRGPDEFAPGVPDPIGGSDEEYEETFMLLEEMVDLALARLEKDLSA